jgi:hypothetical protein
VNLNAGVSWRRVDGFRSWATRKSASASSWLVLFMILALPSVSNGQTVQEVRIRWDAYVGTLAELVVPGAAPPANVFTVLGRNRGTGSLPRERNPEVSSSQILVLALNAEGKVVIGHLIPDPRILRVEGPSNRGELTGYLLHRASTELLIALPDDPAITDIHLYHPDWTGANFTFSLIGTISLR